MIKSNSRLEWVDNAKGIGMVLVILGHVSTNHYLNNIIYSFHMPLFFILSGFLASLSAKNSLICKKVKSLIIPYFKFCFLWILYWILFERLIRGSDISISQQILNIFIAKGGAENYYYNSVMWFLPCLFVTEIIFNAIKNNIKSKKVIYTILILFSIIGYLLSKYMPYRLPWLLDTMCTSIVFYAFGYFILSRYHDNNVFRHDNKTLNLIMFIIIILISKYQGRVDLNSNLIPNYYLLYISGIIGSLIVINISKIIKVAWLKFLGTHSLIIMCIHEPIKRIIIKIISVITNINEEIIRTNIIWIMINSILIIAFIYIIIHSYKYITEIKNKYRKFKIGARL